MLTSQHWKDTSPDENGQSSNVKRCDRAVAKWLVLDDRPFSSIEGTGFTEMMSTLAPNYKIKSRKAYTSIHGLMYDEMVTRIKQELNGVEWISLGTDLWSDSGAKYELICLTAHCILDGVKMTRVLAVTPFKGRHTGENIADAIESVISDYQVSLNVLHYENFNGIFVSD